MKYGLSGCIKANVIYNLIWTGERWVPCHCVLEVLTQLKYSTCNLHSHTGKRFWNWNKDKQKKGSTFYAVIINHASEPMKM